MAGSTFCLAHHADKQVKSIVAQWTETQLEGTKLEVSPVSAMMSPKETQETPAILIAALPESRRQPCRHICEMFSDFLMIQLQVVLWDVYWSKGCPSHTLGKKAARLRSFYRFSSSYMQCSNKHLLITDSQMQDSNSRIMRGKALKAGCLSILFPQGSHLGEAQRMRRHDINCLSSEATLLRLLGTQQNIRVSLECPLFILFYFIEVLEPQGRLASH